MTCRPISGAPNLGFLPQRVRDAPSSRFLSAGPWPLVQCRPARAAPLGDLQRAADRSRCVAAWQDEIAAGGGVDRKSAKNADAPMHQSREAHHSPVGAMHEGHSRCGVDEQQHAGGIPGQAPSLRAVWAAGRFLWPMRRRLSFSGRRRGPRRRPPHRRMRRTPTHSWWGAGSA
jgi:hypothetical protein